jgi:trypsin-like peptidase
MLIKHSRRDFWWTAVLLLPCCALTQTADLTPQKRGVVQVVADHRFGTGIVSLASGAAVQVLTAAHVVKGASNLRVYFFSQKDNPYAAQVLPGINDELDLAILDVQPLAGRLPADVPSYGVRMNSSLRDGEGVWNMDGHWTVVPNAIIRLDQASDSRRFEYTRGSTGPGFSGGPVFDSDGQVMGIHEQSSTAGGGGFGAAVKIEAAISAMAAFGHSMPNLSTSSILDGKWMLQELTANGMAVGGFWIVIAGRSFTMTNPEDTSMGYQGKCVFDGTQLNMKITALTGPLLTNPYLNRGRTDGDFGQLVGMFNNMLFSAPMTRQPDGSFTGQPTMMGATFRLVRYRGE